MAEPNAPSQVVSINGEEIPLEEAQALIETGRKTREYEAKYDTKLDSVWQGYGKSREELKMTVSERDELRQKVADFETKQEKGTDTPADLKKAQAAARELGIVLNEDIQGKYLSKDELETYLSERDEKKAKADEGVRLVNEEADRIAKDVEKSGAPVKFNKKAVLAYASTYGMTDLRQAYEDMNSDVLGPWKEEQLALQKGKSLKTLGSGGKKSPEEPKMTDDNVKDALHESLWGQS